MESRNFGGLGQVSALTLGGGGIGQVWGATSREESVATLRAAADAGIDLIDLAPSYGDGEAERVFGEAFGGRAPAGLRVTTKCRLGNPPAGQGSYASARPRSPKRSRVPNDSRLVKDGTASADNGRRGVVRFRSATLGGVVVPRGGLEPPPPCEDMDLNHARLPIPPPRRTGILKGS